MTVVVQEKSLALQISAWDPHGMPILSVVAKRTYRFSNGKWQPDSDQVPLIEEPVFDEDDLCLLRDSDLFPYKLTTDVVVKGHVYNFEGEPEFDAGIQIDGFSRMLRIIGDRKCYRRQSGRLAFSSPQAVEKLPLSYRVAYGGLDRAAEEADDSPERQEFLEKMLRGQFETSEITANTYPRNPVGKGFLVKATDRALELLELPNIEDHTNLLTSETLELHDLSRWPKMPLPQGTSWINHEWFPRMAFTGILPSFSEEESFAEVERGLIPAELIRPMHYTEMPNEWRFRFASGASLGLQLPFLKPRTRFALRSLHPRHGRWEFHLPEDVPQLWIDGREGRLEETDPVIQTVLIEPDEERLSLVWRGAARARRPYLPEELDVMPFKVSWP